MTGKYDDIITLPHHRSKTRNHMSMIDRAAQFSPFAALTGYEAAIDETGRTTEEAIDLAFEGTENLDHKIRILAENIEKHPEITVTWFLPDKRKSGGAYVSTSGRLRKIDRYEQILLMADGTSIPFRLIYDIDGDIYT